MPYKDKNNWNKYVREYRKRKGFKNSEGSKRRTRVYNYKRKAQLLDFLGNKCVCCGISDPDVLVFDHVYNDGKEDRLNKSSCRLRNYYLNNLKECKKRLQILCANCNLKKQIIFIEFQRLERHDLIGF